MKRLAYILIGFFICTHASAINDSHTKRSTFLSRIVQETDPLHTNQLNLPIISFGTGVLNFRGDIESAYNKNISQGLQGYNFAISQTINPNYAIGFSYLHGKIYGDTYFPGTTVILNFQTEISAYSMFVEYNFGDIRRLPPYYHRTISPFAKIGIELLQNAEPRGDLYSNNTKLHRWTDGSYRDIPQSSVTAHESIILFRDYSFESSYSILNNNTNSTHSPLVFSIPIEFGAEFRLSPRMSVNVGYQYHLTFSNSLDNTNKKGSLYKEIPNYKGNRTPDRFSYMYIGLKYNINNEKFNFYKDSLPLEPTSYNFWDADGDGVCETVDKCPFTPPGVEVDEFGCPVHEEDRYIPESLTKIPPPYAVYTPLDDSISTKELIKRMHSEVKLSQEDIYRFYPGLLDGGTVYRQFYRRIPQKFRAIDTDNNEYIDIEELLHAIDSFFDIGPDAGVGAQLSVNDLFELIEFFFLQ